MKETLNNLSIGNLRLLQAEKGYRYSLDPILLARFVHVRRRAKVADLGTGSGILPLLLARLSDASELIGIEIQAGLADRAVRNVNLNNLQESVRILQGDIRQIHDLIPAGGVDLVVSNPPYRPPDTGRVAPNNERAAARHELAGGLADFIAAASWLLKCGGSLALIYLAERLPALIHRLSEHGIEPKRLRMVHPRRGEAARLVLLEGRKGGHSGLVVEAPLYVYENAGGQRSYTEEVLRMYEDVPSGSS